MCTSTIFASFLLHSPFFISSHYHSPYQGHSLFFITHIHTRMHVRAPSNESISASCMYMCLGWTTWDWTAYQSARLWRRLILPLSITIDCVWFFICSWGLGNFPHSCWLVKQCCHYEGLVEATTLRALGCIFSGPVWRTLSHSKHRGPLVLRIVLVPFAWCSPSLSCKGCDVDGSVGTGQSTHLFTHLFSMFRPDVDLHITHLLQKGAPFMRGKSCACLWV